MLLASRTPLRVSLFGGGTDYPEYFQRHRGSVVGMAIDKYIYVSLLRLRDFIDYRYRLSYSRLETVSAYSEIQHPVVRTLLDRFHIEEGLDISIMADLPARSGLGSSSSFTVGLLNLLHALTGRSPTKFDLAREAIYVEREVLKERVGVQDQYHAAVGGLNRFEFLKDRVRISPVQITAPCLDALMRSFVLVFTGLTRFASEVLEEQLTKTGEQKLDSELSHLLALTDQAVDVLESCDPEAVVREIGLMLHEGWMTKKSLSRYVSNPQIDALYDAALSAGAIGGKLCGAGAGGFLLMVIPEARNGDFAEKVADVPIVRFGLDTRGSTILHS
jgi:D-glycero-alpha-D-manno-heptose-7-phosphate kinase